MQSEGKYVRLKIQEAVIVEGKYDKIKLSSLIDGLIIETNGFQIFKDPEQMAMIRRLAETRGILVLTDSDGAGFVIRNYLAEQSQQNRSSTLMYRIFLGKKSAKRSPQERESSALKGYPPKRYWRLSGVQGQLVTRQRSQRKAGRSPKRIFLKRVFPGREQCPKAKSFAQEAEIARTFGAKCTSKSVE